MSSNSDTSSFTLYCSFCHFDIFFLLFLCPVPMAWHSKNSSHLFVSVTIESIQVKSLAGGKKEGKIYGEVMIEGSSGLHFIYAQNRMNPEIKGPGEFLTLTGPSAPILCGSETVAYLSLYDRDNDHEIAIGHFLAYFLGWDWNNTKFNRPLYEDFEGKYGSVTVAYSAMRKALHATIEVVLIRHHHHHQAGGDQEEAGEADIYGTIIASQYFGEVDQRTTLTLFERSVDRAVGVLPGQPIPLTRSLVEAPAKDDDSCLIVKVDLWVGNDQIAEGSFQYYVEYDGIYDPTTPQRKSIAGKCGLGEVQVSITSVGSF